MKLVLILSGNPTLKNKFDQVIRRDETNWRYHRWNINSLNPFYRAAEGLLKIIGKENLINSDNFTKFVNDFARLADKHFGFKSEYIHSFIQKFQNHQKAQILVLHGIGKEFSDKLKEENGNIKTVHLVDASEEVNPNPLYDYTVMDGESFEQKVLDLLKSLEN